MVKQPKTPKKELKTPRPRGRPPSDPDDVKQVRLAIRAHDDLTYELSLIAREEGLIRSQLVDRVLIDAVNEWHGRQVLDSIGRYVVDPESLDRRSPDTLKPPPPASTPRMFEPRPQRMFVRKKPRS